jgi:Mrp family chromosome partitioning ATPase
MSYDRNSPAVKRGSALRAAAENVASIPRRDMTRVMTRPALTLDRPALVARGLWGFAPNDPRARPFVRLRSHLLGRMARGECGKTIAVVSAGADVGKSFVAANLAAALAELHHVCLIDLNLRDPVIGEMLGAPECAGIDDLLAGERRLSEIGCMADDSKLVVLPARPSAQATRLLSTEKLPGLFEAMWRDTETICIVDTPPILDMDDTAIIGRYVDGMLLVIEEGRTTAADVREALRLMHPTPLVGTVLNGALISADKGPPVETEAKPEGIRAKARAFVRQRLASREPSEG